MLTFVLIFFLVACGIAAYFISVQAKKRPDGTATRSTAPPAEAPRTSRATGSGED